MKIKRHIALLLAFLLVLISTPVNTFADSVTSGTEDSTVSKEAIQAQYLNSTSKLTNEQYLTLMYADPMFNLKAYMYYNEDLMSLYTYDYSKYYKHYLEKGISEKRVHLFMPNDTYNTITLGRYQTSYKDKNNRAINIALACQYMNGTIIMPGETFSYNNAVGPRNASRGFKTAHIYQGTNVVDGIGGGICQVSSTLYTAMIIAAIPAKERHKHSMPVSYLKTNLDATVYWGHLDLKFVNPFDFPIMINAEAVDGVCTVSINKVVLANN